ncbi:hypothetical protein FE394_00140 [Xenorhabdus sp. Reich]|uniref:Uncharacterized protein n=1 Tax=Xenorhabdus littoralis TaxID=2582835 RepID=A0ABU4SG60_9GAMM|nr:hypothetical protein [Xenorhabdus sp. Reich]MDX7997645.1 hypothetical protein [Xenorhabdus sp. Reich]
MGQYSYIPDEFFSQPEYTQFQRCARPVSAQYGDFQYFLDNPKAPNKRPRLNLLGVGDPETPFFKGCLPNAKELTALELANICRSSFMASFSIRSIRLLSSWSGKTGFAQELANILGQPVKAATGVVYMHWSQYNSHVFIEKNREPNVVRNERNFKWYEPSLRAYPSPNMFISY